MNKQDNYEDHLYLLQIRIWLIQDTLILNTGHEIFLEKTLEDIDFIDQVLGILIKKLQENQQRVDREGLLDHLSDIERQFSKILSDIIDGSGYISALEIPALSDRISILQKSSLERRESVESFSLAMGDYLEEPVVSSDEFNELLKDL